MGAGQIGGIATLLDIDFQNAAGFLGTPAQPTEAHFIVYYLSHAMMFCVGSLIEAHVVLTPASCAFGERYKFDVFGGTHMFIEHSGVERQVQHLCSHRGYNHSNRWLSCSPDNLALLVLGNQYLFHKRESGTQFIINRVRYGTTIPSGETDAISNKNCRFYGWGSRRNGYLVPLLIKLYRVNIAILPDEQCLAMWNYGDKYLCLEQPRCKSERIGALCPDDLGTALVCNGFIRGMMTSRLMDRPCGVGFLDLSKYSKFLTCGVDDSRDVLGHDDFKAFDFTTVTHPSTPSLATVVEGAFNDTSEETDPSYMKMLPASDPPYVIKMLPPSDHTETTVTEEGT